MPIPPASCRWPGCNARSKSHDFCARDIDRVKKLGLVADDLTDAQVLTLPAAWEARQAAKVQPSATCVGELPSSSWETPAPFTADTFAPSHSTAEDALAERWAGPPPHADEAPSAEVAEDPFPAPAANDPLTDAFGRLLFSSARYAGVTVEDGGELEGVVGAVIAGLRDLNDRANQRDELQTEVGRLTRELAERTRDLEVVHNLLQDAAPESYRGSPTTVIARALTNQLATFRADLRTICTALDVTVPAAALPVLREWSAARTRGADAEKLLNAIDDALCGAGIDTEVHPHLDGIEKLRSQRDAAQAQLDAGGPSPVAGLVLSPREVTAIGLALDAVLAGSYDSDKRGAAQVIRALLGLPTGKAS